MAFMRRGDLPSWEPNDDKDDSWDDHRTWRDRQCCYTYIPLDNTYVLLEMLATFFILIVGVITYLATYQSVLVDPIAGTKSLFMNAYLMTIIGLLGGIFVVNFFSKSMEILIKRLLMTLAISFMIMLVFMGIKLKLDTTYIKDKFEEIYTKQNVEALDNEKSRISIGITGVSLKTEKEYVVDEYLKLYNIFKIKSYAMVGLHLLLNILLIYQMVKLVKNQTHKEKMNKDDLILFDEEKNISE